jgi:hypothetical protein
MAFTAHPASSYVSECCRNSDFGMERSRKRSHSSKDKDSKKHKTLRSGKWTYEEEVYANRLIVEFEGGHLEVTDAFAICRLPQCAHVPA